MPNEIVLEDTPEARKSWRIAALLYSATVADRGGYRDAAEFMRIKGAALKHGVPDGCQSFADDDAADVVVEVAT
jgi:hypothetical protein